MTSNAVACFLLPGKVTFGFGNAASLSHLMVLRAWIRHKARKNRKCTMAILPNSKWINLTAISQIAVGLGVLTSNVGKKVATALLAAPAGAFRGTSASLAASSRKQQQVAVSSSS